MAKFETISLNKDFKWLSVDSDIELLYELYQRGKITNTEVRRIKLEIAQRNPLFEMDIKDDDIEDKYCTTKIYNFSKWELFKRYVKRLLTKKSKGKIRC